MGEIKECIEKQCQPKEIRVPADRETGALRSKGYVDFETVSDLDDALKMRFEINGEKLFTIKDGPRDSNSGGGGFGGNNQSSGGFGSGGFGGSGNGFGGDSGGFGGNNGFGAGGGSRPPSETTMFINGIPEGTTEQEVEDCINSQCKPKKIRLPKDKETGALRKKGYVDFETVNELEDALKMRFEING